MFALKSCNCANAINIQTNGGNDDYVVALCKISNAISELEDTNDLQYQIDQLKQQLVEKDKEIEKLNKTLEMCKHIERYDIGEMFLENAKLIIEKRQFAIQKLEKVKINLKDRITMMGNKEHSYLQKVVSWYDICNQVNKQIKELKERNNEKN